MQPGEVVVARLSKGVSMVRFLEESETRVTVALGRNKQARVPSERILLRTGIVVADEPGLEEFTIRCRALASTIDLAEVWEVLSEGAASVTAEDLAELYWGSSSDAAKIAALVVHLDQSSDLFVRVADGYTPRSPASVDEIRTRRQREAENTAAAEELMEALSQRRTPDPVTVHQAVLLDHLRGYAIHGEDYSRTRSVRPLLDNMAAGRGDFQRRCFELLVGAGVFGPDEPLELHRAGVPDEFPGRAVNEAAAMDVAADVGGLGRTDLTHLQVITIDDAGTKDRDDALSFEVEAAGPDNNGQRYRIGVHVADAGSLVLRGSAIDREADRRMATLYLPERTIGMLPPDYAHRVGSLEPGTPRLAITLLIDLDDSGEVLHWEVTPSVIQSRAALAYEDADEALQDEGGPWQRMLAGLLRSAESRRRVRESAGAINLDQPEMVIKVGPDGEAEVRVVQRSSPARQLVTELMVLANTLLGEFCRREGLPAGYRSQAAPDLSEVPAETRGDDGPDAGANEIFRRYLVGRRLPPAKLDTLPLPHGGLGVPVYAQATSPLRRYLDLVIQRQVSHFLSSGSPLYTLEEVTTVVQRAEVQMRELARLEAARRRYWFLKFLQERRLGGAESSDQFAAVVLENDPRRRALMELVEYPFRLRVELPGTCEPGEVVGLRLEGVDLWRRVGHFVHVGAAA